MTLFKKIYLQQEHSEIGHNRSSFQLGQTGGRSGQAVIKSQRKHSLTHGSCRFHYCRNANIFLTSYQELVHGAHAWVFILTRESHAVIKSHRPETGLSAEFINDKTRSSLIRSSMMKTSYYAKSCELCTCHTCQERHCWLGSPLLIPHSHLLSSITLSLLVQHWEEPNNCARRKDRIRAKCQVLHW